MKKFKACFSRALCWAQTTHISEEWLYIVRWYWIRACPMMCEWWCKFISFTDQNSSTKKNKRGGRSISSSGEEWRRPKMKTKLATEREWWCANDLPITQGSRTCLDLRNGRGPCVSQTLEVIRLIWPITWNDSSCCLCVVCSRVSTHTFTKPQPRWSLSQDKTVKFMGQMIRINTNFTWWCILSIGI